MTSVTAPIHDRMPVILPPEAQLAWMSCETTGMTPLHRAEVSGDRWGDEGMREWLRQHGGHE